MTRSTCRLLVTASLLVAACNPVSSPTPVASTAVPASSGVLTPSGATPPVLSPSPSAISRDQAVAIARAAAPWLGPSAIVAIARQDRYANVRNTFAPEVSPPPSDDRLIWTVNLFNEAMQQGETVTIDATDGRVLQAVRYIV